MPDYEVIIKTLDLFLMGLFEDTKEAFAIIVPMMATYASKFTNTVDPTRHPTKQEFLSWCGRAWDMAVEGKETAPLPKEYLQ